MQFKCTPAVCTYFVAVATRRTRKTAVNAPTSELQFKNEPG